VGETPIPPTHLGIDLRGREVYVIRFTRESMHQELQNELRANKLNFELTFGRTSTEERGAGGRSQLDELRLDVLSPAG
jgi:hypothetical protein